MNPQATSKAATEIAWIDGEIGPARDAKVPLLDRGFMFAEAAYEVCVGRGGRIFAWDEHRKRLERTLTGISIPEVEATLTRTDQACRELTGAFGPGMFLLYLQVTGGVAPRLHVLPKDPAPAIYGFIRPHDRSNVAREQERGLTAITKSDVRWHGATFKTTQLLPNVLAKKASRAEKVDDVIFVSSDGIVLEGAATNVFWVDRGAIRTCPLTRNILPGISRELLRTRLDVPFAEVEANLTTVLRASEVFMTGTTRDVTAVVQIDGQTIADGRPGPVTRELGRRFAELFEKECP